MGAVPTNSGIAILYRADGTALLIAGNALAAASGNGASATTAVDITGAAGQATTSTTNAQSGGAGSNMIFTGGAGGAATGATGTTHGGDAGATYLIGGAGGAASSTSGTGGQGGSSSFQGGAGGAATGATGTTTGGIGGSALLTAGRGGANTSASGTGGLGGSIYLTPGAGGAAGSGATGAAGSVILAHNGSTAQGNVGVRNNAPSSSYALDATGRINATTGYNGILGSDLAASPARGASLQWNDGNSALQWSAQSNNSNFGAYSASALVHTSQNGFLKVQLDSELFDGLNEFDTANKRFTALRSGLYQFFGAMYANGPALNTRIIMSVFVNGSETLRLFDWTTGPVSDYIPSAGLPTPLTAGDVVEMYIFQSASSTTFAAAYTRLYGYRIL